MSEELSQGTWASFLKATLLGFIFMKSVWKWERNPSLADCCSTLVFSSHLALSEPGSSCRNVPVQALVLQWGRSGRENVPCRGWEQEWPSHTGIHGIHLAGGCSAPGLEVPLGLTAAAGSCQERVGALSWPAVAGLLETATAWGHSPHGTRAGDGI